MNFFLKILNETRGRRTLKVNGYSGGLYLFNWDAKMRAYKYHPKDQGEVDDLFRTMGRSTAYTFAPVNVEKLAAAGPGDDMFTIEEAATLLARQLPKIERLTDKQVEECLHRGVIVTDEDDNETAKRLIAAYDKGSADTLASLPTVKKNPRRAPRQPKAQKPPA